MHNDAIEELNFSFSETSFVLVSLFQLTIIISRKFFFDKF